MWGGVPSPSLQVGLSRRGAGGLPGLAEGLPGESPARVYPEEAELTASHTSVLLGHHAFR